MKVSLAWLRDLVAIDKTTGELAEILTRGGIEVGSVERLDAGLEKVVIGRIREMSIHPDADRLWVCQVDIGSAVLNIVTGAQNLLAGDRVPVALIGANLPNGLAIQASKLRGVISEGMLCSAEELMLDVGVRDERSKGGILILASDAPVGERLAQYLGQDDSVLDLELYPNRPDCLAMVNVAREVASMTGAGLQLPQWADPASRPDLPAAQDVRIVIEAPELCRRYAGLIVEDVKIEPSPLWMQRRLQAAGVRPINNIVDITNYVMLELGQPLHAFDRDNISGAVHVRRAGAGETLTTLDGVERKLDPDMLLIADDQVGLGLAGVMGGLDSEITSQTKRLFVESAHFAGVNIRRTSRRLNLLSEASNRFEKGVDPYGIVATLGRVCELIKEMQAGRPVALVDEARDLPSLPEITISVRRAGEVLGMDLTQAEVQDVLQRLAFPYRAEGERFMVSIPSYRPDLQIEEDLIEEVARLTGYDRIPTTLPAGNQTQGARTPAQEFRWRLRHLLTGVGMDEVLTYSFTNPKQDEQWGQKEFSISLRNPLREELRVMRTSLVPGLLEIATRNVARRNTDMCMFEIGNVYLSKEQPLRSLPDERLHLTALATGGKGKHWLSAAVDYDFYYMKGIVEEVAREFWLEFSYRVPDQASGDLLHPGRAAEIFLNSDMVGFFGEIHPALEKEWGLPRTVILDIELTPLLAAVGGTVRVAPIPRFPAIQRDLALVVAKDIPAATVVARIRELGGEILQRVEIFDVYTGKPIPEERKSLAFSLRYQSLERTLTDEEVNSLNARILKGIQQEFGAEWRK